ncbi:MAG: hypothetical protein COA92_00255 [Sulfurovum sp.]|nr:MAG: hypothetical protein COA92_00255 [Sulfurovum sp.]
MLELGISQAQSQFTKLLNKTSIIIDKKSNIKKAVILPYEEYSCLLKRASKNTHKDEGVFDQFVGTLDNTFKTDDSRYNRIVD